MTGGRSDVASQLAAFSEYLTETYLISAYDIGVGLLPSPSDLPVRPQLIFVDSGGYEIAPKPDPSEPMWSAPSGAASSWSEDRLSQVLARWPEEAPAIFVSFDAPGLRRPFIEQVGAARALFKGQKHLSALLLKPETKDQNTLGTVLKAATANADELVSFDMVGVTDSELGLDLLTRMCAIARLREALDAAHVAAPIHVFGALDPISSSLYFLAGAEIFDGLTWLRYAFHDDSCVYYQDGAFLKYGVSAKRTDERVRIAVENLYYLERLQHRLRDFHFTRDFKKLPHGRELKEVADSFQRKMGRKS